MGSPLEVTVYRDLSFEGKLCEDVAREAFMILALKYGLAVNLNVVEIPADSEEGKANGLPLVIVDGKIVIEGRVPSISEIVDSVFKAIEDGVETRYGFPVMHAEAAT